MLTVDCIERLEDVKKFAAQRGLTDQLQKQLDYLGSYCGGNCECKLYSDFAPYSFSFTMLDADGKFWFNGGLIYQGPTSPADGSFPSLTVSLASGEGWFVHT